MWRIVIAASLIGCQTPTSDVTVLVSGTCQRAQLADVEVLSVELFGVDDEGGECALARRCAYEAGPFESIEDVADALGALPQPVLDVTDPDAHTLAVFGHASSCFADEEPPLVCGFADLADAGDGTVEVRLHCGDCEALGAARNFCP
jgi:hypothetical protein